MAVRKAGFGGEIIGVGSPGTVRDALAAGAINSGETLERAVARADLIYLAWPILRIVDALAAAAPYRQSHALITDAGSTKRRILEQASRCFPEGGFLGGHPMAGKESRGVQNASEDLFDNKSYVLTPASGKDLESPVAQEFLSLLERINARVLFMDADEHDRVVALTSHLCQLVSTALSKTVIDSISDSRFLIASGRGLLDMTRLADSPHEVWADILSTNEDNIRAAVDQYLSCLESLKDSIGTDLMARDFDRGQSLLKELKQFGKSSENR